MKWDGRIQMKSIDAGFPTGNLLPHHRRSVQLVREWLTAEVPRTKEVIFGTSSRDRRFGLTVDEEHVIPFSKPLVLVLQDRHGHADELSSSFCFNPNVVVRAVQIRLLVNLRFAIGLPIVRPAVVRLCLPILRVEIKNVRRANVCIRTEINVVVEGPYRFQPFIRNRDASVPPVGHREEAVQRLYASHRKHLGLPIVILAKPEPEEISHRGLDTWSIFPVPKDTQHNAFEMKLFVAGNREPYM